MPVALSNAPTPQTTATPSSGTSLLPVTPSSPQPADFLFVLARQASAQPTTVKNVTTPIAPVPVTTDQMAASLADLLTVDLPQGEVSEDRDLDTEDTYDEDDALAMAEFLPGLCAPAPSTPVAASKPQTDSSSAAVMAAQSQVTDALVDGFAESADEQGFDSSTTPATPTTPATQAAHAAQAHSGITHQMAASSDAAQMARNLQAPVGTPAWSDELGGQLTWMAANGRETATLRLSPENMGPMEIKLSVQDGEAKVWFGAANADTRSALEQSLPRLRELFASQGLVLADAGVHRDAPRHGASANNFAGADPATDIDAGASVNSVTIAHVGLIDTYV
jgi:flagellar hook-length control protein FliK